MPRVEEMLYPRRRERFEDRRKEQGDRKLLDDFFDHSTLLTVSGLINSGAFQQLDFPVATGKEGGVFRASTEEGYRAVKVYRIGNSSYRRLPAYALDELRRETSIHNFTGLIVAWTRREHTLLGRLTEAGVRVPRPFAHRRNVLVMEYIGDADGPAPRLTEAPLPDPAAAWSAVLAQIRTLTLGAGLVHGDLSPYNTLWFKESPVLIDVAQAVSIEHPAAYPLLERDLRNFAAFFHRRGVEAPVDGLLREAAARIPDRSSGGTP
ncbi:MAG: serine protein kinase RIO [Thermoplasmata archaeon]|jgi:RIO kinase 1